MQLLGCCLTMMTFRMLIALLLAATVAEGIDCNVQPSAVYSRCQVDLTVAIDMSTAMGNLDNVDALVQSVQSLLTEYVYGSNTEASVITFGAGGIDSSNYVNDWSSLCRLVQNENNHAHNAGLYDADLRTVLLSYQINQPANAREYQRVLILFTAIEDDTQIAKALPIAQSLQNNDNVQIITVGVGNASLSLSQLGSQNFSSSYFDLDGGLINRIASASCINSGVTYATNPPPTAGPTTPPTTASPISPYINGSDGLFCATNPKNAWLDLVIVVEQSSVTFSQWNAIIGSVSSMISKLTLSNTLTSGHTSRIALITYDAFGTVLQFNFTSEQTINNLLIALKNAKPSPSVGEEADIASGLKAADNYLTDNPSFRVPGVVLYAATYDDSGTNDPKVAADGLKANLIKIVTVSFDAANGVSTAKINALSSPGLHLDTHATLAQFGWAVSQLNCRCAHGWTQLVVNNEVIYADCFFYQDTTALQQFAFCENTDTDTLALAGTPARVDFIEQLVSKLTFTDAISVGLSRPDGNSQWTWGNVYPYSGYPAFAQQPSDSDVYGYLSKSNGNNWQLLADDGVTVGRFYVCQRRSGDTDNIINLK